MTRRASERSDFVIGIGIEESRAAPGGRGRRDDRRKAGVQIIDHQQCVEGLSHSVVIYVERLGRVKPRMRGNGCHGIETERRGFDMPYVVAGDREKAIGVSGQAGKRGGGEQRVVLEQHWRSAIVRDIHVNGVHAGARTVVGVPLQREDGILHGRQGG